VSVSQSDILCKTLVCAHAATSQYRDPKNDILIFFVLLGRGQFLGFLTSCSTEQFVDRKKHEIK